VNVKIDDNQSPMEPNEPSIFMNPKNTDQLVGGANIDKVYYSSDGGLTWNVNEISSPTNGVWGDPTIVCDTSGNFYFFHLSDPSHGGWYSPNFLDRIVCQKSTDGGVTWSDGSFMGIDSNRVQDKQWTVVDWSNSPYRNTMYTTWTKFDVYGVSTPTDSSVIMFSKSVDEGVSWSHAKRINKVAGDCVDGDYTVEGAVPCVGPNGEVYVSWASAAGIIFDRSLDSGNTWLTNDVFVTTIPGGWDYSIPGLQRANGLPVTCCDISNSSYRGNIYINWTDQSNGTTDTDVWFIKSTDGGNTWSTKKRVNDDPAGKQNFLTWMAVDDVTGYIYVVFYDRRNYTNNQTDVYIAYSTDGGDTFVNQKISATPFTPTTGLFFGDYINITAHNNIVRPIWTRTDGGQQSIWTAIYDNQVSVAENNVKVISSFDQNYPNPFTSYTTITFNLNTATIVNMDVYDIFGKKVATLISNEMNGKGSHELYFDNNKYNLASGIYYVCLNAGKSTQTRKMSIINNN